MQLPLYLLRDLPATSPFLAATGKNLGLRLGQISRQKGKEAGQEEKKGERNGQDKNDRSCLSEMGQGERGGEEDVAS